MTQVMEAITPMHYARPPSQNGPAMHETGDPLTITVHESFNVSHISIAGPEY